MTEQHIEAMCTYLESVRDAHQGRRPGWIFASHVEAVLRLADPPTVLDQPSRLPDGVQHGELGACYRNAWVAATSGLGLTYTEGYATSMGLALPHAWVTDTDGTIIDPTWQQEAAVGWPVAYLGVRFTTEFISDLVDGLPSGPRPGVFSTDYRRDWTVLRRGLVKDRQGRVRGFGDPPPF